MNNSIFIFLFIYFLIWLLDFNGVADFCLQMEALYKKLYEKYTKLKVLSFSLFKCIPPFFGSVCFHGKWFLDFFNCFLEKETVAKKKKQSFCWNRQPLIFFLNWFMILWCLDKERNWDRAAQSGTRSKVFDLCVWYAFILSFSIRNSGSLFMVAKLVVVLQSTICLWENVGIKTRRCNEASQDRVCNCTIVQL